MNRDPRYCPAIINGVIVICDACKAHTAGCPGDGFDETQRLRIAAGTFNPAPFWPGLGVAPQEGMK